MTRFPSLAHEFFFLSGHLVFAVVCIGCVLQNPSSSQIPLLLVVLVKFNRTTKEVNYTNAVKEREFSEMSFLCTSRGIHVACLREPSTAERSRLFRLRHT